jgi:hypothetical protein
VISYPDCPTNRYRVPEDLRCPAPCGAEFHFSVPEHAVNDKTWSVTWSSAGGHYPPPRCRLPGPPGSPAPSPGIRLNQREWPITYGRWRRSLGSWILRRRYERYPSERATLKPTCGCPRMTPAIEAGLADQVRTLAEITDLPNNGRWGRLWWDGPESTEMASC